MSDSPPPHPRVVRSIALMNQKGGVGKTTTSVNLAAGIARLGRRVLLIDLDPQAHASLHLGLDEDPEAGAGDREEDGSPPHSPTAYDLLLDPDVPARDCMRPCRENLWVIPAETDLAAAETELAGVPDRTNRLRRKLDALEAEDPFDFVLFDCPPSLGLLTLNALAAAREVFIPMQAHFLALQGVSKLLETVGVVAQQVNPRLRVTGVLLCMHDAQATHSREVVSDLEAFFENARGTEAPWRSARVYKPAVRRNIKLAECPSFGQSVFEYAPGCAGADDYEALAKRVVAEWDALRHRRGEGAGRQADANGSGDGPAVTVRPAAAGASSGAGADRQ